MNKLLEDYKNSVKAIADHVSLYDINLLNYIISEDSINAFWSYNDEDYVMWADTTEELETESGNYYESEVKYFFRGADFCIAIISSDFGGDDFAAVFLTSKEQK